MRRICLRTFSLWKIKSITLESHMHSCQSLLTQVFTELCWVKKGINARGDLTFELQNCLFLQFFLFSHSTYSFTLQNPFVVKKCIGLWILNFSNNFNHISVEQSNMHNNRLAKWAAFLTNIQNFLWDIKCSLYFQSQYFSTIIIRKINIR